LEDQRDKLSQQLEELFQVRKTDAEQALDDLTALYESRSKSERYRLHDIPAKLCLALLRRHLHCNDPLQPKNPLYRLSKPNSPLNRICFGHLNQSQIHPNLRTHHPIQQLQSSLISSLALLLMPNSTRYRMNLHACATSSQLRVHLSRSVNGELLNLSRVVRLSSVVSSGIVFFVR
jgi:hypothetical protein